MTLREKRATALGAVRSQMRRMGIDFKSETANDALTVLDDIARTEPNLIASEWYLNASDNQIALFKREWRKHIERVSR